jgi:hypothetical protein
MKTILTVFLLAAVVLGASPTVALAQFHGDIRHFHEHDWALWRGGRWFHGRHGGRAGWWWIAGGVWYFYPKAVYPYPNPYIPPQTTVIVQAPPVAPPPQPVAPPPPAQNWYYCNNPHGYYPYVQACAAGWITVPAAAPDPLGQGAPPISAPVAAPAAMAPPPGMAPPAMAPPPAQPQQ